ncbi:MAG: xanthine dehydrogenase family protein molybdopterin-binding subunit [Aquificae bacterium]|nr:xanthine dehydrogenase family protein molybdopterin-binding subunit [Aquificota bacterium]
MISRREFLKLSGLTLVIALTPSGYRILHSKDAESFKVNAWINIKENNTATIYINKSEMGQGVYTGLTSILADEMEFPIDRITVKFPQPRKPYLDPKMNSMLTGGSTSIRNMFMPMRKAGAVARELFLEAGARALKVKKEECIAKDGRVIHKPTNQNVTYGELIEITKKLIIPVTVKLKNPEDWKYIGKSVKKLDTEEKVNGKALYGTDIYIEGMVYASVIKPVRWGSKLKYYSVNKPVSTKIIDIFPITSGVAVCGKEIQAVWDTKRKIHTKWSKSKIQGMTHEDMIRVCKKALRKKGAVAKKRGNVEKALKTGHKKIEAEYSLPYLYHATAEPLNCVVNITEKKAQIWIPTQAQTNTLKTVKRLTGLPEENIEIYTTFLGGGFGRKSAVDFVTDAVEIAQKIKRPIKLFYSREDDISSAHFRPIHTAKIEASLDKEGNITAWKHRIASPSLSEFTKKRSYKVDPQVVHGVKDLPYEVPNLLVEYVKVDLPVPLWYWRSVASSHNAFTIESFIDEIAYHAKKDPVEFRLQHLFSNIRASRVIETVAEKANWKKSKNGQAMGIAYYKSFRSHVAQVVEVSVDEEKKDIEVHKVVTVIDLGPITVNPELVKMQIESAVIMGLSSAIYEEVQFEDGKISSTNFDTYRLLRIDKTPKIEVYILNSQGRMGGVGEPGLPPVIPALTNAVFWATGKRIRDLPLIKHI